MNGKQSPAHSWHGANLATRNNRCANSIPWQIILPPYAASVAWKSKTARSQSISILMGSKASDVAQDLIKSEKRYADALCLFAILPFGKNPDWYDWRFVVGRTVAVKACGTPETDLIILSLARCLLEANAALVAIPLAIHVELFQLERGVPWRL